MVVEQTQERAFRQTARDIIGIFFFKKRIFVLTFVGVVFGALLLSILSPSIYETSAQLMVKPQVNKPLMFDQDSGRVDVYSDVKEQALNSVIYLLTSPEVLRDVVLTRKMADADDEKEILAQIASLQSSIKAEPMTLSSIVRVSLRGRNPAEIKELLTAVIDSYIKYHIKVNQTTAGRLDFFDEQTTIFRDKFAKLNDELVKMSQDLNVIDPRTQRDQNIALIRDLEVNRNQLNNAVVVLRGKIESFASALNRFRTEDRLIGLPSETLLAYPAVVEMEKSLAQLVINRQRAKSDYVAGSKQVQDADAQYFNMKMQIKQQLEAIIDDLQHQNASTQKAIDETDRRIAEIKKASINLSGSAVEMERLALEQKLVRDNYSLYSAKREEARINEEKDKRLFANVTIASHPQVPVTPWFPQRGRIMMLSIPLALMLALAFSASSYAMEQRLWTPTDISMRTNLRYLGSLDSVGIVEKTFGSLNFLRWTKGDRSS